MLEGRPAPIGRSDRTGDALRRELARERRALRHASRTIPRPVPWEWARERVIPVLAAPETADRAAEPVRAVMEPGCLVEFALAIGDALPLVDVDIAERWECTTGQIRDAAVANLRRSAAAIDAEAVTAAGFAGYVVELTRATPWTASLVLVPDQLMRLFGDHDQVVAAPGRSLLVSLETEMPVDLMVELIVDLEMDEAHPLMLDPFVLRDGHLAWEPAPANPWFN